MIPFLWPCASQQHWLLYLTVVLPVLAAELHGATYRLGVANRLQHSHIAAGELQLIDMALSEIIERPETDDDWADVRKFALFAAEEMGQMRISRNGQVR